MLTWRICAFAYCASNTDNNGHNLLYMVQDTLCIDSTGGWLSGWGSRHARAGTHCLRGPLTHSPHKSPTALQQFYMQMACVQVSSICPTCRTRVPQPSGTSDVIDAGDGGARGSNF